MALRQVIGQANRHLSAVPRTVRQLLRSGSVLPSPSVIIVILRITHLDIHAPPYASYLDELQASRFLGTDLKLKDSAKVRANEPSSLFYRLKIATMEQFAGDLQSLHTNARSNSASS